MDEYLCNSSAAPRCDCGTINGVSILDVDHSVALRFIRLHGAFYGGTTHDSYRHLYYGPHCQLLTGGLLDLIASLATEPERSSYLVDGHGDQMPIRRYMNASRLAAIVGCSEREIRDHFEPLVKLA